VEPLSQEILTAVLHMIIGGKFQKKHGKELVSDLKDLAIAWIDQGVNRVVLISK